jgi:hypothetical protein
MNTLPTEVILLIVRAAGSRPLGHITCISRAFYRLLSMNRAVLLEAYCNSNLSVLPTMFYDVFSMEQKIQLENDICAAQATLFPTVKGDYIVDWPAIFSWAIDDGHRASWILYNICIRNFLMYFKTMMSKYVQYRRYICDVVYPSVGVRYIDKEEIDNERALASTASSIYSVLSHLYPNTLNNLREEYRALRTIC